MVAFGMTEDGKPLHPGRILLVQAMEPLGISRNQLARDIDVPVGRISDITNGKRGITADTALRLGRYFGTGPELWLRLQAEFDLHVARITTWPAVESRVRTLEAHQAQDSEAPPPAPIDPEIDAAGLDEDGLEPESYALPGDLDADNEPEVWAPAALPENGADNSETPSFGDATADIEEEKLADGHPEPLATIAEGAPKSVAADTGGEEDIGIPPAPADSTTPV